MSLRVERCGVCASSLPLFQGPDWFSYPCPPGVPVRAAVDGALDLDSFLTHQFSLERLGQAFGLAEERPSGFIKGWART